MMDKAEAHAHLQLRSAGASYEYLVNSCGIFKGLLSLVQSENIAVVGITKQKRYPENPKDRKRKKVLQGNCCYRANQSEQENLIITNKYQGNHTRKYIGAVLWREFTSSLNIYSNILEFSLISFPPFRNNASEIEEQCDILEYAGGGECGIGVL